MANPRKRPRAERQGGSRHMRRSNNSRRPRLPEGGSSEGRTSAGSSNAASGMPVLPGYIYDSASNRYYKESTKPDHSNQPKPKHVDKAPNHGASTTRRARSRSSLHGLLGGMENGRVDARCEIAGRSLSKRPQNVRLPLDSASRRNSHSLPTDESVYPFYHSGILYLCGYPSGAILIQAHYLRHPCNIIHTENATVMCNYDRHFSVAKFDVFHNNPGCIYHHFGEPKVKFSMSLLYCAEDGVENIVDRCHEHLGNHSIYRNDESFSFSFPRSSFDTEGINQDKFTYIDTITFDGDTVRDFESRFVLPKSDITAVGQKDKNIHVGLRSGQVSVMESFVANQWSAAPLAKNHSVCDIQAPSTADRKTFFCSYLRNGPKNLVLWDTRISGKRGPGISFKGHRNSHWKLQMHASEDLGIVASGTDEGMVKLWDCRKGDTFMDAIDMRSELGIDGRLVKVRFERGSDFVHKALWIETNEKLFLSRI